MVRKTASRGQDENASRGEPTELASSSARALGTDWSRQLRHAGVECYILHD
jgi:hypothetical protein